MNLIKLSEQLKDVPDNYLAQEIQQPSGNYPAYLIISELSRRKRMREGVQKPEPETTVAEDLAGQGGLAATPQAMQSTAGMDVGAEEPQEIPQMAGGGLVAFKGGMNVNSPQGGLANDPLWQLQMQDNPQLDNYARDFPDVRELPDIYRQIQKYSTPISEESRASIREEGRRRRAEEVPFGREEEARRIAAREQALEGERSSNVNMALMEAGLGMMASRAPRGIQGVAEGGLKGLSALRAGKQEIKKSEAYLDQAKDKYALARELYDEKMYAAGDRAVAEAERQQALGLAAAQARFSGIKSMFDVRHAEEMRPFQRRAAELGLERGERTLESEIAAAALKPDLMKADIGYKRAAAGQKGQPKVATIFEQQKALDMANLEYQIESQIAHPTGKRLPSLNSIEGQRIIFGKVIRILMEGGKIPPPTFLNRALPPSSAQPPGQGAPQPGADRIIQFNEFGQRRVQ